MWYDLWPEYDESPSFLPWVKERMDLPLWPNYALRWSRWNWTTYHVGTKRSITRFFIPASLLLLFSRELEEPRKVNVVHKRHLLVSYLLTPKRSVHQHWWVETIPSYLHVSCHVFTDPHWYKIILKQMVSSTTDLNWVSVIKRLGFRSFGDLCMYHLLMSMSSDETQFMTRFTKCLQMSEIGVIWGDSIIIIRVKCLLFWFRVFPIIESVPVCSSFILRGLKLGSSRSQTHTLITWSRGYDMTESFSYVPFNTDYDPSFSSTGLSLIVHLDEIYPISLCRLELVLWHGSPLIITFFLL